MSEETRVYIREEIKRALEDAGYKIYIASQGEEKCDHLMGVEAAYHSEREEYIRASNPSHAYLEEHERFKFCPDCGERLIDE